MAIQPKPRQEVEAAWREYLKGSESSGLRETRNVGPVLYLTDPVRVPFRGHLYVIPPIPYTVGLEVIELQNELVRHDRSHGRHRIPSHPEADRPAHPSQRQANGLQRHPAAEVGLRVEPFTQASEMELGEFLAGFLMRRTMRHE
jgi:hypothetical protein